MKKFSSFSLRFFSSLNASASPVSSDGCFKGIPLRGKVKIVDHFPDSKVKVTARGRGYHLRHLSREPPQHPISSRSTSRISP